MKILLLSFFFAALGISNAQNPLKANAGENQHFCFNYFMGDWLSVHLGGNPTASGGVPPYSYRWWTNGSGFVMGGDTTESNPYFVSLEGFTAYLEVRDAVGSLATDSTVITTSNRPFQNTFGNFPKNYYILKGDSVWLEGHGLIVNESYKKCQWKSEIDFIDIKICDGFWVKPDVTTHYDLIVTDNYGCSEYASKFCASSLYKVYVDKNGIKDFDVSDQLTILSNPANETLVFSKDTEFVLTNIHGKILMQSRNAVRYVDISSLNGGLFFIIAGNQVIKLIKQ
jgi:hypothetical protein